MDSSEIVEHMQVIGSDGVEVGTVDRVEGDKLKLTKSGSGDGTHRYIPIDSVESVEDGVVHLSCSAEDAMNKAA